MQPEHPMTPDEIVNVTFSTTRFVEGYDQDEVDDFLDGCVAQLRDGAQHARDRTPQEVLADMRRAAEDRSQGWFARRTAKRRLRMAEADPSLLQPSITAAAVAGHVFTTTRFRDGYDMMEVDEVLDRIAAMLAAQERGEQP